MPAEIRGYDQTWVLHTIGSTARGATGHREKEHAQREGSAMASENEQLTDELWDEFHRVVTMTSRELREWLAVRDAGEDAESLPDQAGTETGRHVLHILGKRRTDLTERDVAVMRKVVAQVLSERREDLEPTAGQAAWRHKLMTIGHDPLKPVSSDV